MKCMEKCNKISTGCKNPNHPCQRLCGEPCGPCTFTMEGTTLPCGHTGIITCAEKVSAGLPQCQTVIQELSLPCGHTFAVRCFCKDRQPECIEDCNNLLACGHRCAGKCLTCYEFGHSPCLANCGKALQCLHSCDAE